MEKSGRKKLWFNRMVEYWNMPGPDERARFLDHVRLAKLQVVQTGHFGPFLYGLADDPKAERYWAGMPLVGVRKNLEYAAELIRDIQDAGAQVIGQLSLTWHYANHNEGLGLFGSWNSIWSDDLLGSAPCSPEACHQILPAGSIRSWDIVGRPYQTYSGCMCNPAWLSVLKPMVKKAIDLGVDGLNAHHNFESFCACEHCRSYLIPRLTEVFGNVQLRIILGGSLEEVSEFSKPHTDCPEDLGSRFKVEVTRAANLRRKEFFDELLTDYGRSLKPDLILAQWYHKYDFNAHDERSMLPDDLWAKGEDYIWYSQGPYRWLSAIKEGFLGDMGMPARYVEAMGKGKPFIIMKYDYKRWRLWIGEAAAHQGASFAFHAGPPRGDTEPGIGRSSDDFYGPAIRYQQFLANHQELFESVKPWSQIGLVYPRRAERAGESESTLPLKRMGRVLEDHHFLFDILMEESLSEAIDRYELLILPEIERMSTHEIKNVLRWVECGGNLLLTDRSGIADPNNIPHQEDPFLPFRKSNPTQHGKGTISYLKDGPWEPNSFTIDEIQVPTYPIATEDPFSQSLAETINESIRQPSVTTNAPWYVRMRTWRSSDGNRLTIHWVNYLQDEDACIEVPIPTGPIQVTCSSHEGKSIDRVEWIYPEMKEPTELAHTSRASSITFTIPNLIVYGISILHLKP